jgi:MOB kinase activator 1
MSSFLTTMFVSLQSCPPAQPLPPQCTLKQSSLCMTAYAYSMLDSSESTPYCYPSSRAAQHLRDGFSSPFADLSPPSRNARTRGQFKPQRANKGTSSYQLRQFAEATLGSGSLRKAVKLPEGEDLNEWLAVNGRRPAASKREESELIMGISRRFLQPDQPALRLHHRVLLPTVLSGDESNR